MYQSFRNNGYFVTTFAFFSGSTLLISMSEFYSNPGRDNFFKPIKITNQNEKVYLNFNAGTDTRNIIVRQRNQ